MRYVEKLPRTPEQEAVALGIATDLQKAEAKKQRRYLVTKRPYYPSMAEITEAFKWLADRGFGQAPKTVQIEGSVTTGFKMVFRRWAPGTDPASLPLADFEQPPPLQVLLEALELGRTHDQAPLSIIARDSFRALAGSRARRSVSPEAAIA